MSGGLENLQRGVPSRSSPAPPPRSFSSARSLMLLPKGKPKIPGQEDELQRQRSGFVFGCSERPCQDMRVFYPPLHQRLVGISVLPDSCPGRGAGV